MAIKLKANIKVALDSRDLVKEIMAVHTFKCKPFVLIVPPWCYPRLRSILQKTIKSLNSFIKSSVIGIHLSGVCTCLDLIQYSNSNVLKVLRFWLYYEKRAAPFNFFMFKDFLYGTMSLSTNSFIHSSSGSR